MGFGRLEYYIKVLSGVRIRKLSHCITIVRRRSGRSRMSILRDMLGCARKYGAGYYDYMIFEYDQMDEEQRATYMTRMTNKALMTKMNDAAYTHLFGQKNEFYEVFADYLGRDYLDLSSCSKGELAAFLAERSEVMAKPAEGECGHGIEKIRLDRFSTVDEACEYLIAPNNGFGVVEDVIIQHPEMRRLYPDSVNCLRMTTLLVDGKAHMLYAVLKTGNNGNFVDNLESGGFACHVDRDTGVVCGPGHTSSSISDAQLVEVHPATGVAFRGFEVPFYREAVDLVCRAALKVPQVRYIGWDVCITETGPAIIEGNNYAAYDFPQLPDDSQPRRGLLGLIRDLGVEI